MFFLLGMAFMGLVQALLPAFNPSAVSKPGELIANARIQNPAIVPTISSKPWGDFEYTKLPLEEPRGFLPNTLRPLGALRWFFAGSSQARVEDLFNNCGLTEEQRRTLSDSHCWQVSSNGCYVFPPSKLVLEIRRTARERIYSVLADSPINSAQYHPFRFRPDGFEEWFADTGLGPAQLEVLRKLIYNQGGSLCFCDGAIVQALFSTNDFNRLVKSLYGERTFLMRLRVAPETDIDALVRYWGRGGRGEALRPLLESMSQVPGGASVNISYLLPPFARMRLYTYANPNAEPATARQNCFWTAMNFFNEKPDDRFVQVNHVQHVLDRDYQPVSAPPAFGDLIMVRDSEGKPIHMCVYLADDVVFTKNGSDYIAPWVLMKLPDMLAWYQAKDPAQVTVFRNKKG